jgi:hypothetical protein
MRRLLLILVVPICFWHCHGRTKSTPPPRIVNTSIPFEAWWVNWDSAPIRGVLTDNRRWVLLQNESLATVSAYSVGCFDTFGNRGNDATVTYEVTLKPSVGRLHNVEIRDIVDTLVLRQELCDDQERLGIVVVELEGGRVWQAGGTARKERENRGQP